TRPAVGSDLRPHPPDRLDVAVAEEAARGHGGGAVGTRLPDRLHRGPAPRARLLQPRRADRADDVRRLDGGPADGALERAQLQPLLDRADLQLALAHVLEVLRRTDEEVHDRAEEGDEQPHRGRERDEPGRGDPPACVLQHPERGGEPEQCCDENRAVAPELPAGGCDGAGWRDGGHVLDRQSRILPTIYPSRNAPPTIATSTPSATAKTTMRSRTRLTPGSAPGRRAGRASRSRAPGRRARARARAPRTARPPPRRARNAAEPARQARRRGG